ncbi:hypothetical protein PVK06_008919 [Gossypium arboreum]|uniref:Uncharacterized protein n=1 Tax=Gossypium arboreum TaxID=29729 RepID=A0ABR0QLZ0_GOSAR|nr:hypothetical protein PVK06_008919 [Gossypium arboreum]
MLLDCEARQDEFLVNITVQANLASKQARKGVGSSKNFGYQNHRQQYYGGGFQQQRGFHRGRSREGRFSHTRPQCQLCGKNCHIVQKCYYRFDESFAGVSDEGQSMFVNHNKLLNLR